MSLSRQRRERLAGIATDPLFVSRGKSHFVAAGGLTETCFGGELEQDSNRWCVVGTGVHVEDDGSSLLLPSHWRQRLLEPRPPIDTLGGGFVALRIHGNRVEAFSDPLGLRTLYWLRHENGVLFSTRPDWLAQLAGGLSIDWRTFGSHWMAYNQLSSGSLVRELGRLGSAGCAEITARGVTHTSRPFPLPLEQRDLDIQDTLSFLLSPSDPRTLSLGLSGGIDSRTLLALQKRKSRFAVHVFGSREKADVTVAMQLAQAENLSFSHFHVPPPDPQALLAIVRDHSIRTQAVSPASSALGLRYYPELRSQGKLVVDGAFGELLRRQFMNRLLRRGRDAIKVGDSERILACIRSDRARVFAYDIYRSMKQGALRDIGDWLESISDPTESGFESVVDILNVRTRLPNFFGYEQARLDELVQSYMPFAHPRAIDAALSIPPARRRGGRVARSIIARRAPRLRRYPLVKGEFEYPYGLPAAIAGIWLKIKSRLASDEAYSERGFVLNTLKEFILDRIHSSDVKQHAAYDWPTLNAIAMAYYASGTQGDQLDWWLAFDLWRAAVES